MVSRLLVSLLLCGQLIGADAKCPPQPAAPTTCLIQSSGCCRGPETHTSSAITTQRVVTCGDAANVQHLSCEKGVIIVQAALYGRRDTETCSEGKPASELSSTSCTQSGTLDVLKERCNGKEVCEIDITVVNTPDPCPGTYKYLDTTYSCFPAVHSVTCEGSLAYLQCDDGQLISVLGAFYGRSDQSTCIYGPPTGEVQNVQCHYAATEVADSCNDRSSCSVKAADSVFDDPCSATYKYLEVAYICKHPENGSQD